MADTVREFLDGGFPPDEIAVMSRAKEAIRPTEAALSARGVPFTTLSRSLWEHPVVLDVAHWIRIAEGKLEKEGLLWVLSRPPFSFDVEGLARVLGEAEEAGRLVEEAAEPVRMARTLAEKAAAAVSITCPKPTSSERAAIETIIERAINLSSSPARMRSASDR